MRLIADRITKLLPEEFVSLLKDESVFRKRLKVTLPCTPGENLVDKLLHGFWLKWSEFILHGEQLSYATKPVVQKGTPVNLNSNPVSSLFDCDNSANSPSR